MSREGEEPIALNVCGTSGGVNSGDDMMPGMVAGQRVKVAITGPTGTICQALVPQLERDPRIGALVGIARRAFDPSASGWATTTYRRGDVRDETQLADAFAGADAPRCASTGERLIH